MRTVYLNGHYLPETGARISIFDRGFLFADAVYEVTSVIDGRLVDFDRHIARLARSMGELKMAPVPARAELLAMHRELVARNGITEGLVYLQVTRGNPGDRDFQMPGADLPQTILAFTQERALVDQPLSLSIITMPDKRWGNAHIKTTQLLYASLMKSEVSARGADDAWLVRDGYVTEATSKNAHIVTKDGVLVTHPLDSDILHGITQAAILELAREGVVAVEVRPFTVAEAQNAAEALATAAATWCAAVTSIDGVTIGDGKPGPVTKRLREIYIDFARRTAI